MDEIKAVYKKLSPKTQRAITCLIKELSNGETCMYYLNVHKGNVASIDQKKNVFK